MTSQTHDPKRARAEALFRRREEQKADAPVATREYRDAERARLSNMHRLRRLRETDEARR